MLPKRFRESAWQDEAIQKRYSNTPHRWGCRQKKEVITFSRNPRILVMFHYRGLGSIQRSFLRRARFHAITVSATIWGAVHGVRYVLQIVRLLVLNIVASLRTPRRRPERWMAKSWTEWYCDPKHLISTTKIDPITYGFMFKPSLNKYTLGTVLGHKLI